MSHGGKKIKTNNRIVFYRLAWCKLIIIIIFDSVLFCDGRDACITYHLCHLWGVRINGSETHSFVYVYNMYTAMCCATKVYKYKRITQPNVLQDAVNEPLGKTFMRPRISVKMAILMIF